MLNGRNIPGAVRGRGTIGLLCRFKWMQARERFGAMMERGDIVFPDPKERTPTILLVDDEVLIRLMVSDFLQECGFKTLGASSADEAIEVLSKSQPFVIDLVLSDVRMPGIMDGFGLARWIRQNRPGMPVILCSGDVNKAQAAEQVCAGEPFLAKPFDLHFAVAKIRQLLDAKKARS